MTETGGEPVRPGRSTAGRRGAASFSQSPEFGTAQSPKAPRTTIPALPRTAVPHEGHQDSTKVHEDDSVLVLSAAERLFFFVFFPTLNSASESNRHEDRANLADLRVIFLRLVGHLNREYAAPRGLTGDAIPYRITRSWRSQRAAFGSAAARARPRPDNPSPPP